MKQLIEVIKLKERDVNGRMGWVMDKEDFKRLVSKYGATLSEMNQAGLSRGVWKNTLEYYGWDVNIIQGLRQAPWKEGKHGNSDMGFTSQIEVKDIRRVNDTKIAQYLNFLDNYFPGLKTKYSDYHYNTQDVLKYLSDKVRTSLEIRECLRYVSQRVRKWAKKKKLPYINSCPSNFLEHHFAKILDGLGIEYIFQYPIGKYLFDFYLPQHNLLIEVDGGGHRGQKDIDKLGLAKTKGFRVLKLEVKDRSFLKNNHDKIKNKICKECGL